MTNRWPTVIDVVAVAATSNYLVQPRTPVYTLAFVGIVDLAVRFRFTSSQPWVEVTDGDSYTFMPPLQDGIEVDLATTGANPAAVALVGTTPCQLTVAKG